MLKEFFVSVPVSHANSIVFVVQKKKIVGCLFTALTPQDTIEVCTTKLQGKFDNVHVHDIFGARVWSAR